MELEPTQLRATRPGLRAGPRAEREDPPVSPKSGTGAPTETESRAGSDALTAQAVDVRTVDDVEPAHVGTEAPPDADPFPDQEGSTPDWFKTAVFYEVLVRSFRDSNGDGVGDFQGLIEKLDYLEWLGVDCLWIPPFFSSPLRDGGYDVSDYTN